MTFRIASPCFSPDAGRSARVAAALAAIAAALLAEASAADTVRLRYGFKPQAAYQQTIGINLVVNVDKSSVPAPLLLLLQSMAGEVKQDVASKASVQMKTRSADGSLPLQYRIVEAKGTMTQGGQSKPIPAIDQAASKPPADGRVAADGRSLVLDAPPEGTEGIPKRVRERVADAFPALPDKDLRIGDTFETRTSLTLPAPGKGERLVEMVWVYTLKTLDTKSATFDVRQTVAGAAPPAAKAATGDAKAAPADPKTGQKMDVTGGGKGSAVFDRAAGLFSAIQVDLDLTVSADVPLPAGLTLGGGAAATNPDGSGGSAPLRIKALVKGPMVMTLAPS